MASNFLDNHFCHPHQYRKIYLSTQGTEEFPVHILQPSGETKGWILSLHGITDKTEDWLSLDNYGLGLSMHRGFLQENWGVVAPEYMDHGERGKVYPDFLSHFKAVLGKWETFYSQTNRELDVLINHISTTMDGGTNLGVFGFSLGGLLSMALASIHGKKFKCAVSCASPIPENPLEKGALQKTAPKITDVPVLMVAADKDVHSTVELNRQAFELVKSPDKHLMIFSAEHKMVPEYIAPCISWMKDRMNRPAKEQ